MWGPSSPKFLLTFKARWMNKWPNKKCFVVWQPTMIFNWQRKNRIKIRLNWIWLGNCRGRPWPPASRAGVGHFVHFCKIYNLQVTELPREPYLSTTSYLRIFTNMSFFSILKNFIIFTPFQCLQKQNCGVWRPQGK